MLIRNPCPLGGLDGDDVEIYPASFDVERVDTDTFSARRIPDRVHYRMVRNRSTGCLRADPILDDETVLSLYRGSRVNDDEWEDGAAQTYLHHIKRVLPLLPDRRGLLEIGCGHGFLLERLLDLGFEQIQGVEPSTAAVARAEPTVKSRIVEGLFRQGLFAPASFSLICGFQVLDHLPHPNHVLQICLEVLAPGGVMLWICHDEGALSARLLGRCSPIVDIQHVVLYNRRTVARLFERNGFTALQVFGVANRYPLGYWTRMAPVPTRLRLVLLDLLRLLRLSSLPLTANLGNLGVVAVKKSPNHEERTAE